MNHRSNDDDLLPHHLVHKMEDNDISISAMLLSELYWGYFAKSHTWMADESETDA